MQRLTSIAASLLFLAVPLFAQHGGGGHAGGHGGGGFAGHSGFSGGHAAGGMHSGPVHSGSMRSGPSRGFTHVPFRQGFSSSRFSGGHFRGRRGPIITQRGFRRCIGCRGFGYPWWGYGAYDPYWWGDSGYDDSSYDQDYEQDRATANQMNAESLEEQQMLRQEEADGDQDAYARQEPRRRAMPDAKTSDEKPASPIVPATILVFRDQHRQEVQNYAIVGHTLWNFAPQHTQRIALSDLDLIATAQANDDQGVSFRVPAPNEGQ